MMCSSCVLHCVLCADMCVHVYMCHALTEASSPPHRRLHITQAQVRARTRQSCPRGVAAGRLQVRNPEVAVHLDTYHRFAYLLHSNLVNNSPITLLLHAALYALHPARIQ